MSEPTLDTTADELAELLGVDPEAVMVAPRDNQIVLSHAQARRLLVMARSTPEKCPTCGVKLGEGGSCLNKKCDDYMRAF